jgi:prefoldin subunit 5
MQWAILVVVAVFGIIIDRTISQAGGLIGKRLDELEEKIDGLQEKLDEIEDQLDRAERLKRHVNPIDL